MNLINDKEKIYRKCDHQGTGELLVRSIRGTGKSGGGVGSNSRAAIPPANAEKDPRTKAGRLPPPNSASQGPLPTDTIICGMTIERFNTPIDRPWPPPAEEVKVAQEVLQGL